MNERSSEGYGRSNKAIELTAKFPRKRARLTQTLSRKKTMSANNGIPTARRRYQLVVDDRVLLLGIDKHYRDGMKLFEAKTLLSCASVVANRLNVAAVDVPVEGYYAESPELTRYFKLMRALQDVPDGNAAQAKTLAQFQLIWDIVSSPMYGRPQQTRWGELKMLPTGRDSLSQALLEIDPSNWNVETLVDAAHVAALEYDDISLVGLAARARDSVAITALRESVVLYSEKMLPIGDDDDDEPDYEYVWRVNKELERSANRFIGIFNSLVADANHKVKLGVEDRVSGVFTRRAATPIPKAEPENAAHFYECCQDNEIFGRCVHLGTRQDDGRHYHWAFRGAGSASHVSKIEIDDFWSADVWTTQRYRNQDR